MRTEKTEQKQQSTNYGLDWAGFRRKVVERMAKKSIPMGEAIDELREMYSGHSEGYDRKYLDKNGLHPDDVMDEKKCQELAKKH